MSGVGSSLNGAAAPIRQPRGPSPASSAFGSASAQPLQSSAPSRSPPKPDGESLLRRNNTISSGHATSRHHFSASISASPAASSAFHGGGSAGQGASSGVGRFRGSTPASTTMGPPPGGGMGFHRFRSGSMSSTASAGTEGAVGGTLSRRQSGRDVQRQEILAEAGSEEDAVELGSWGRGLGRQSSLPSRRGMNPVVRAGAPQPDTSMPPPPPRPPRRISAASPIGSSASPTVPTHSASHSLSSLAMLGRSDSHLSQSWDQPISFVGGLSRTQSLRAQAQAKITGPEPGLGRSSSMRTAGEIAYRSPHIDEHSPSPSGQTPTHMPSSYFGPPTPPPMSSTAALPPFQMPSSGFGQSQGMGADVRRHKSMNQAYARDGALSPEQRDGRGPRLMIDPLGGRALSPGQDRPPTSPIGPPSVWSMEHQPRDDGWSRPSQQLQEAFDAMSVSKAGGSGAGGAFNLREPQPGNRQFGGPLVPGTGAQGAGASDEPAWVTNLVGTSPQLQPRSASAQTWHDRENGMRNQFPVQQSRFDAGPYLAQTMAYLQQQQQQQQQLLSEGYGGMPRPTGMPFRPPGQPIQFSNPGPMPFIPPPYGSQVYPTPPPTAGMLSQPQLGPVGHNMGPPQQPPHPHMPHQQQHHLANQDAAVIELARSKGLNPATFNCRPAQARFFVIKSYTEDDVQKSLKHEIWSSTVLGNKRLDAAFKESSDQMPIYLFFSVNGSRHFCGVAQMLTPVDESQSSDVWAQDKWKGIFRVKWIFVRDVPSMALRHIRLINTPEQKPITNSRDTQEIHYEGGCEVLQIFLDHQTKSKTSLLQDFAYYEQLSAQRKNQNPSPATANPGNGPQSQMSSQSPHPNDLHMNNQHAPGPSGIPPVPPIPARFR